MAWWHRLLRKKPKREYDETVDGPLVDAYMDVHNLKLETEAKTKIFNKINTPGKIDVAAAKAKALAGREVSVPTGNYFEDQDTIEQWQFVLQYDPNNIKAYLSIGEILFVHKQKRKARKCFRKALEIDPTNEHAMAKLRELR